MKKRSGMIVVMSIVMSSMPPRSAGADETLNACGAAAVNGQRLRRAGKLREARAWFEVCGSSTCRADILSDCKTWRDEIDRLLPAIVIQMHDADGTPIRDARVMVDGTPVAPEAIAQPITLDPGPHIVEVERDGMRRFSRSVVLREGERTAVSPHFEPTHVSEPMRYDRPIPPAAFVSGGVALAGLVGFGVAAGIGYANYQDANCGARCPDDPRNVRTTFLVADVSLVVAVLAGGLTTWLYVTRPLTKVGPLRSATR